MEHKHHTEEEHLEEVAVTREDPEEVTAEEITRVIKKEEKKEWMLPASIVIAALMISVAFIYATGSRNGAPQLDATKGQEQAGPKIVAGDVPLGNADAKVTIIEYGDFQCPGCGNFFTEAQPFIKKAFIDTGKAKMVYKPLAFLGPESENSVSAAECAKEQGKFWEMHDAIFSAETADFRQAYAQQKPYENSGNLNITLFKKIAGDIGLNQDAFITCYNSGKGKEAVATYMKEAKEIMGEGFSTPSIYVNGKKVDLRVVYDQAAFTTLIEAEGKK